MLSKDSQRVFFSSKKAVTIHGFDLAFRALRAAEIQVDRIWVRPSQSRDSVASPFEDILIDVHFYFISLRNLYRFLHLVIVDPTFTHLQPDLES